jgi:hypothetical protein
VALCAFDLDGCEPTLEEAKAQFQKSWNVAAVSRQVYLALFLEGEARPQCDAPMIAIPKRQIDGSPS